LTATLAACLFASSLAGCGGKSNDQEYGDKLQVLLDEMDKLEFAAAPVQTNELVYTNGTIVDDVQIPGRQTPDAAYVDQALTLLPQARDIATNGSESQKRSANLIIATILADEASLLNNSSGLNYQLRANQVVTLRNRVSLLQEIASLQNAIAADRDALIDQIRTSSTARGQAFDGLTALESQLAVATGNATAARNQLQEINAAIADAQRRAVENKNAENSLVNDALSAVGEVEFEKLDAATTAARNAAIAEAQAEYLAFDAEIQEMLAELAEANQMRLQGLQAATPSTGLMAGVRGLLDGAASEVGLNNTTPVYNEVKAMIEAASTAAGSDAERLAIFCADLNGYQGESLPAARGDNFTTEGGTLDRNSASRVALAQELYQRIYAYVGEVGMLEVRVNQLQLEKREVADILADLDTQREDQIAAMRVEFERLDHEIQIAGFDRMAAAADRLQQAADAYALSGASRNGIGHEMSIYNLHARALSQRLNAIRAYAGTLDAFAAAGPGLLGPELHGMLVDRSAQLQTIDPQDGIESDLEQVHAQAVALHERAEDTFREVKDGADRSTPEGFQSYAQAAMYGMMMGNLLGQDLGFGMDMGAMESEGASNVQVEIVEEGDGGFEIIPGEIRIEEDNDAQPSPRPIK